MSNEPPFVALQFPAGECDYYGDNRPSRSFALFAKKDGLNGSAFKFQQLRNGYIGNTHGPVATACPSCRACVPLRTNISDFTLSRTQARLVSKTPFTFAIAQPEEFDIEVLYDPYNRYMSERHSGSSMAGKSLEDFADWVEANPILLIAYWNDQAIAFSSIDGHEDELSLDYSVFDPDYKKFSLGQQLWLQTMLLGQRTNMDFVYVGPWASGSAKLDYKRRFKGLEAFQNGQWVSFSPEQHFEGPDNTARLKAVGYHAT